MSTPPYEILAPSGDVAPVIVHVPHSAVHLPSDVRDSILLSDEELAAELLAMTDLHTDVLAEDTGTTGATRFVNRWSRLAVDPERFDDPDLEEMEAVGMGAVYTATSRRRPLREAIPELRADLLERHFHPYHMAFTALVDRFLAAHGTCAIVDLHSYPTTALPYELHGDEPRPPLAIGTDARHTPAWLSELVTDVATRHDIASGLDQPFSGTFVPTKHLGDPRVHSVMLEIRRDGYLDERTGRVHAGEARIRRFCTDVAAAIGHRLA